MNLHARFATLVFGCLMLVSGILAPSEISPTMGDIYAARDFYALKDVYAP